MVINIAINGFGRIGKNFFRTLLEDDSAWQKINVAVINIGDGLAQSLPYLIEFDTLLGNIETNAYVENDTLFIKDKKIKIIHEKNAQLINWKADNITWVVDATGSYTDGLKAKDHLESGAEKVLITAPAKNVACTIIPGINNTTYKKSDTIVSLGSCTTNAIVPMLTVINNEFGIENAYFTTIHSYTNSQTLLDLERRDLRDSRAAGLNIIPSTTGANKVISVVMPELTGIVHGISIRVPTAKVSLIDLVCNTKKIVDSNDINEIFNKYSKQSLLGILGVSKKELVSSDFSKTAQSVIIDEPLTIAQNKTCKIFGWYDNEWAYSLRIKDFLLYTIF
jgi:glyceraldehyde 3-phosphate dehydrogenase